MFLAVFIVLRLHSHMCFLRIQQHHKNLIKMQHMVALFFELSPVPIGNKMALQEIIGMFSSKRLRFVMKCTYLSFQISRNRCRAIQYIWRWYHMYIWSISETYWLCEIAEEAKTAISIFLWQYQHWPTGTGRSPRQSHQLDRQTSRLRECDDLYVVSKSSEPCIATRSCLKTYCSASMPEEIHMCARSFHGEYTYQYDSICIYGAID